jgi:hypothetical protein
VLTRQVKLHSKRVEKMGNHTRNEWERCETTLETSVEIIGEMCNTIADIENTSSVAVPDISLQLVQVLLHSFRV